jgi:hypothetical protein
MTEHLALTRALTPRYEVGAVTDTAAEIVIVAGDNPEYINSDAAFAKLAGVNPRPVACLQLA